MDERSGMTANPLLDAMLASGLIRPSMSLVVACSGGPDSVALTCLLASVQERFDLKLHLAHLAHGWRPAEAEMALVRALSGRLGLPLSVGAWPIEGPTSEATARQRRRAFLLRVQEGVGAERIALAHHRDDQAETVLLQLVRGGQGAGMAAGDQQMPFVRPLLSVGKAEILSYLEEIGQPYAKDPTNEDPSFARNFVRRRVLPLLEEVNPQARVALWRAAEVRQGEEHVLAEAADGLYREAVSAGPFGISLDLARLRRAPVALQRRVMVRFLQDFGVHVSLARVERFRTVLWKRGLPDGAPRQMVLRRRGDVLFAARTRPTPLAAVSLGRPLRLRLPGPLPGQLAPQTAAAPASPELLVRAPRRGDMVPFSGRHVKIADMLARAGVPQLERSSVPVLAEGARPIWPLGIEGAPPPRPGAYCVRLEVSELQLIVGRFGDMLE